jgi:flap endonuclease-1
MGYKCENAYGEAEATCAFLNRIGTVDGVLTEDTDVLAYRTPIMFHNLSIKDNKVMQINIKDILGKLDIKENEFLDFCILCGTDYNRNLNMIGPQKSFKLIKKYETIDKFNIEDKLINSKAKIELREFNYTKIRKLFNPEYNYVTDKICKEIDMKELKNFCFYNNLNFELLN